MAQYNGIDKDEIVDSIDQVLDLIWRDGRVSSLEKPLYDWIDGRKLAMIRQSSSDEELARMMSYTGADKIFAEKGRFLLSIDFNMVSSTDYRTIERLKSWNAFTPPKKPGFTQ